MTPSGLLRASHSRNPPLIRISRRFRSAFILIMGQVAKPETLSCKHIVFLAFDLGVIKKRPSAKTKGRNNSALPPWFLHIWYRHSLTALRAVTRLRLLFIKYHMINLFTWEAPVWNSFIHSWLKQAFSQRPILSESKCRTTVHIHCFSSIHLYGRTPNSLLLYHISDVMSILSADVFLSSSIYFYTSVSLFLCKNLSILTIEIVLFCAILNPVLLFL